MVNKIIKSKYMRKDKTLIKRKLTLDIIKNRLKQTNPNIEILSDKYINSKTKLKCKCLIDGYEWDVIWNSLQQGIGCPMCSNMAVPTIEQIKEKIKITNPNIKILSSKYVNSRSKLNCVCKIDGYEWKVAWGGLRNGTGCPKCAGKARLSIEGIKDNLKLINANIVIMDDIFIDNSSPLNCMCLVDGYKWIAKWSNLRGGSGCPECAGLARLTLDEVKNRLKYINPDIEILSDKYVNAHTHLKCKCLIDGYEWDVIWNSLRQGQGCPKCNASKGEKKILNLLIDRDISYNSQYYIEECRNINPLPFDFALFDNNKNITSLIEYDGIQHFEPIDFFGGEEKFKQQQHNDNIKNQYCKDNNIPLLRMPYWEFDNIEEILHKWLVEYGLIEDGLKDVI